MPSLEKLKRRFTGRPLLVVAVNVDEPEARIRKFLAQFPLSFPILLDPGRQATKAWNVRLMPTTFVIGADGRIRYAASGGLDWSAPEVVERIADLFGKG
jgi:peroxiredoxin